ncbi:type II toxin-antitoxin system Phd/YefM family antitoxin [Endozoicomonas sp. ONNA2]|uniref:type II toxin-antitoxin system Phd/YefM family antitoxin n=1 Tax=Endozoicomonas sp. ONNA2 TaxID=2828741 RepID=UPI002148AE98|nr:type II toxin-antitoxin system prevent-host-death family antitoxin [Endozoicomonas sp. ONNA2]
MPESSASKPGQVINMHEAKTRLSQLGEMAWRGERVIISRAGKPYLKLVPYRERRTRKPGRYKDEVNQSDTAFGDSADGTDDDIVELFEGGK